MAMSGLSLTLAGRPDYKSNKINTRRCVLENREQLDQFLASIERKAFRIAQIATSNPDDALELVQESMMKLVENYASKPENEWTPLFYRILNSKINDWYRKQSVRNRWMSWFTGTVKDDVHTDPIENAPDLDQHSPSEALEQQQATHKIIEHLQKLSPRQQQAFLLRAWEGLSVEETAFAMGCTEGSVKTHFSRAVHTLRQQLEEFQ
jgi:RNA polymerase sigma-70 factor (ECF subfamily)